MRTRWWLAALVAAACRREGVPAPDDDRTAPPTTTTAIDAGARDASLPRFERVALGPWLAGLVAREHPRVLAFGELHARTDRPVARSALSHFTDELLPAIGASVSDLVVETWVPPAACGARAAEAGRKVDAAMRRPPATKSELAALGAAARAAGIQPHALRLTCADHAAIAPASGDLAVEVLLDIVTRELARVTASAVAHRDREPGARPLVVVYGGALHNDLDPYASVAAWSIGPRLDALTGGRAVEIDLYVPEYAEAEPLARTEAWFPLLSEVGRADALVVERGPRSYVVLLPREVR